MTENCSNGYFTDPNDTTSYICKCDNIKCYYCSFESMEYNLCESCNIKEGYYPKINDSLNIYQFINCYNDLKGYYLDYNESIYKPCNSKCETCTGHGDEINNNCQTCISGYSFLNDSVYKHNCYEICEFYYYFDSEKKYHCTLNQECPKENNKLIRNKTKCIENCTLDDIYKYEYFNECYEKCPKETQISEDNKYLCKLTCPGNLPYENKRTIECVESCNTNDLINNICIKNNLTAINSKNSKNNAVINLQKDLLNGNMNDTLKDLTEGSKKDVIFEGEEGMTIQLTTTENQNSPENQNRSTIRLGKCEDKLKENYNIDKDKPLIIFKIDIYEEGLLIPKIEYEVYNPDTLQKLNLTVCEDTKIDVGIPVSVNESDICKHNISCGYYKDICYNSTSENGTDMSVSKRKKDFVENNMTLCEENCDFKSYDSEKGRALCSCKIKISLPLISEISFDKKELYNNFFNIKNLLNLNVMKCYTVLFTKKGIKNNYGVYIIIPIIFIQIICIILFYSKGYRILKKKIKKIIDIKLNITKKKYNETNIN